MGLMLFTIHIICLILISAKAAESETGQIDVLRNDFPVRARTFALEGKHDAGNGCSCAKETCSCCGHLYVPKVIDKEACVDITYVPAALGLQLKVILDGKVIYSTEVSVRNPPPICIGIPFVKKYAKICLDFYNLTWRTHVGGCLKIQVRLLYIIRKDFDIGCFNFNGLDEKSKQAVSRILFALKFHQIMVQSMKGQNQERPFVMKEKPYILY